MGLLLASCSREIDNLKTENASLKSELQSLRNDYEELLIERSVRETLPGVYLVDTKFEEFATIDKIIFVNDSLCILKDKFTNCLFEGTFEQELKRITIKTDHQDFLFISLDSDYIKGIAIPGVYVKQKN
jgi:hypothetical protein